MYRLSKSCLSNEYVLSRYYGARNLNYKGFAVKPLKKSDP